MRVIAAFLVCAVLTGGCGTAYHAFVHAETASLYADAEQTRVVAQMEQFTDGALGKRAPEGDLLPFTSDQHGAGYVRKADVLSFSYDYDLSTPAPVALQEALAKNREALERQLEGPPDRARIVKDAITRADSLRRDQRFADAWKASETAVEAAQRSGVTYLRRKAERCQADLRKSLVEVVKLGERARALEAAATLQRLPPSQRGPGADKAIAERVGREVKEAEVTFGRGDVAGALQAAAALQKLSTPETRPAIDGLINGLVLHEVAEVETLLKGSDSEAAASRFWRLARTFPERASELAPLRARVEAVVVPEVERCVSEARKASTDIGERITLLRRAVALDPQHKDAAALLAASESELVQSFEEAKRRVRELSKKHPPVTVTGEILDRDRHSITVWGKAIPDTPDRASVFGGVWEDAGLVVLNPDESYISAGHYTGGYHYFLEKRRGAWVYGDEPRDLRTALQTWSRLTRVLSRLGIQRETNWRRE